MAFDGADVGLIVSLPLRPRFANPGRHCWNRQAAGAESGQDAAGRSAAHDDVVRPHGDGVFEPHDRSSLRAQVTAAGILNDIQYLAAT